MRDRQPEKRVRRLVRAVQDPPERHQIENDMRQPFVLGDTAGRAAIGLRDAIALPRVMEPLPVEIDRRQQPDAHRQPDDGHGGEYRREQPEDHPTAPGETVAVETKTRIRRHYVVIAQQPQIDQQHRHEQAGMRRHQEAGQDRDRCRGDDKVTVERGPAKPARPDRHRRAAYPGSFRCGGNTRHTPSPRSLATLGDDPEGCVLTGT